jgi:transcriptional regulator GlxA family with amidase domain
MSDAPRSDPGSPDRPNHSPRPIRIAVLALEGCVASSVAGPLDVFAMANRLASDLGLAPPFAARIVTVRPGPARSFSGLPVGQFAGSRPTPEGSAEVGGLERLEGAESQGEEDGYDLVLVPAVVDNLAGITADREAAAWLRSQHAAGARVAGVCAGVFLLAEAGLLDNREATTHWALAGEFTRRYPQVALKPELLVVDDSDVLCAGGVTAYLDLCLHLVARLATPELAALCAKILLVEPGRRFQAPFALHTAPRGHGDAAILKAQDWLEAHLSGPIRIKEAAQAAHLGERTLLRRFRKATGDTPLDYVQRLRIELAKRLLETTPRTVDDISQEVGYADPTSFRRLFKAKTGLTPDGYRRRFAVG